MKIVTFLGCLAAPLLADSGFNPSVRPEIQDGADFFFAAEALYWQPRENGLQFAAVGPFTTGTADSKFTFHNPHFEWSPGARVALGYNTPRDGWDLTLLWTYFRSHAHNHEQAGSGELLIPLALDGIFSSTFFNPGFIGQRSSAHWDLHLDLLDLEWGRQFRVSRWLSLRPFVGLRSAFVNQKYDIRYDGIISSGGNINSYQDKVDLKNDYWGLGLRTGVNGQWNFTSNWSFFSNLGIALLYGFFDLGKDERFTTEGPIVFQHPARVETKDSFHIARAITDLALGLRWDRNFSNDRYHVALQLGWEQHYFFGFNQFLQLSESTIFVFFQEQKGDLSTQGVTFSGQFDF